MKVKLSESQKIAVLHDQGALLVVAGPGSGKTRVLTERIRRLLSSEDKSVKVLGLTFTNKAANEMKERLSEFPDIEKRTFIGTMHSFCTEVLANRGKSVGIDGTPHILERYEDRKQILFQGVMADPELRELLMESADSRDRGKILERWLEVIRDHKMKLRLAEAISEDLERKVYEAYNEALRASNVIDYDDLLLLVYQLFQEKPKIADFYRRQYSYVCVDEGQDLNESQYGVLTALCGDDFRNVMVVGDPKQAIFVWNGASPQYLDRFCADFKAQRIELNENYRSSKAVIDACQALNPYPLTEQFPIKGELSLVEAIDEADEAKQVASRLQQLWETGHPDVEGPLTPDRCALIGRTRYALNRIELELQERGIQYYKSLSSQPEDESMLMGDYALALRLLANPANRLHFELLCRRWKAKSSDIPLDFVGKIELLRSVALTPERAAVLDALEIARTSSGSLLPALEHLTEVAEKIDDPRERDFTSQDLDAWKKQWDLYLRSRRGGEHSLATFLTNVALGATQAPRQEGVALLTVHSAKGLEFEVVCIMGMADGTFPDYRAKGPALQEERRNAFVAFSRARRIVICSYPRQKTARSGDVWQQKPSPYLKDVGLLPG